MTITNVNKFCNTTEIAMMVGVEPHAISMWKKRYPDFPQPVSTDGRVDLFDRKKIYAFVQQILDERRRRAEGVMQRALESMSKAQRTIDEIEGMRKTFDDYRNQRG